MFSVFINFIYDFNLYYYLSIFIFTYKFERYFY
nr:MAG TPA: hypothetical protein [Bacteriophage sp.]